MTIYTNPKNVERLQNMLSDWSFLEKFIQFWVQSESELWTILMNHCVETHLFFSLLVLQQWRFWAMYRFILYESKRRQITKGSSPWSLFNVSRKSQVTWRARCKIDSKNLWLMTIEISNVPTSNNVSLVSILESEVRYVIKKIFSAIILLKKLDNCILLRESKILKAKNQKSYK